jgi:hypothetical protein
MSLFASFASVRAGLISSALGLCLLSGACSPQADDAGDSAETTIASASPHAHTPAPLATPAGGDTVTVYKTATCGCCQKWVEYMKANGFTLAVHDVTDLQHVKDTHGITDDLQSCHTALVNGYLVEGHVPIEDVRRMLKERPQIAGIAAPGMPMGSPGMESPIKDKYDVVSFTKAGTKKVFERH